MPQYRVTKYDPALRDETGAYTAEDDWTEFGDVGKKVSREEYERVEGSYLRTAVAFLEEAGLTHLQVRGLEERGGSSTIAEGQILHPDQWRAAFRAVLRNEVWCRFETESAFVHFGWDLYMYIGTPRPSPAASALASDLGLFVEAFESPYLEQGQSS